MKPLSLCRGRLPTTFRSRGADDRKLPSVFYADTRINSAIQQIYHKIDDNNEGGDQYKDALNHGVIAVGDRSDQKDCPCPESKKTCSRIMLFATISAIVMPQKVSTGIRAFFSTW